MRQLRIWAAALAGCFVFSNASADEASVKPEANGVVGDVRIDACASDATRLGLSRIVEIDTAGGSRFGSSHLDFLNDHEVILTFDDGPMRRHTEKILEALADQCTKATFFMVGRMAAADPEMVREVAAAGHTVASHTWSHLNQRALSPVRGIKEIELGISAVSRALGRPAAPFFRFPYLSDNRRISDYVASRNMSSWWVDVDSKDYTSRNSKRAHDRVMAGLAVQKKGIILMHDIQPSTVGMIRDLLNDLHAKGYKVVHIVPKAQGTTIADFDEMTDQYFKKKVAAVAENPLAKRSVVWPMSPMESLNTSKLDNPEGTAKAKKASRPAAKPSSSSRNTASKADPALPWQPKPFGY